MRMGLREANQHFSKAIRAVKAGEEVVLTERGKPIAILRPFPGGHRPEAVIRQLEAAGLLRPASKRSPPPRRKPVRIRGGPLSKTLREERDLA